VPHIATYHLTHAVVTAGNYRLTLGSCGHMVRRMPQNTIETNTWVAPEDDRLLTIEQAAEWAQIRSRTFRKLWARGEGPPRLWIGGSIRIRWGDLKDWATSRPVDELSA